MRYIAVEGCVGSGKTTVVDALRGMRGMRGMRRMRGVLREPVEDWTDVLGEFYSDPYRFATRLQMSILRSRAQQLLSVATDAVRQEKQEKEEEEKIGSMETETETAPQFVVTERSIDSSSDVFVPMMEEGGFMDRHDVRMYESWREMVSRTMLPRCALGGVIYLDAPPETCAARIRRRSRPGEHDISLEYLSNLHRQYDVWLKQLEERGVPVVRIPAGDDGDEAARLVLARVESAVLAMSV